MKKVPITILGEGDGHRVVEPSRPVSEIVGSHALLVSELAMFKSRGCVLLGLVVLAEIVMVGRRMVMMRGGLMVSGRLMVMLARRMPG